MPMKRKADVLLIIGLLGIAGILWLTLYFAGSGKGGTITITQYGTVIGSYSLTDNQTITLPAKDQGYNVLVIENGMASVTDADCKDKLCVYQKSISKQGECIICLPHHLIIEVTEGAGSSIDAVAH